MAQQPLRRQWPSNQKGLKAKMKPPSPCGYTGVLVELYQPVKRNEIKAVFYNEESDYRYVYTVPEHLRTDALTSWHLMDRCYLVIELKDGKEQIKACQVSEAHDSQNHDPLETLLI